MVEFIFSLTQVVNRHQVTQQLIQALIYSSMFSTIFKTFSYYSKSST
jgi:hypothetical protein